MLLVCSRTEGVVLVATVIPLVDRCVLIPVRVTSLCVVMLASLVDDAF